MKLISSLLLLLSTSFSAIAMENEQAESWLKRLSQSLNTLNFNTSFVVVKNNQAEPYHWFHGVDETNTELEILSLLNGPRRDVLRKGQVVSYIEPELPPYSVNANHISGPIPAIYRQDITALIENYEFISVGRSRVLGKSAQLIRIVSRDGHRFGHWLWLDMESGLPLKMALITRKGQLLEQIQFTHLEITEKPAESLNQLANAELPQVLTLPDTEKQPFAWQVNWLPEGFERIQSNRHRVTQTKQPVEFMLFNDGLVDISVYVNPSADKQRPMEYVMNGATVVLNQVNNGIEVSVVGKIPSVTAKAIADSIAPNAAGGQ
ncbi:transcriptional regulator [Thalassotalea sp. M1531]|uniref:Transcriptional regulator n=1 Tax=Thalassotalea algicola TaxID=2716224 RepID=A0A7Y0L8L9_9GAMM|nr:MucB/RseB C-terminal domain-containing protein [Thalassotalea algicola]NMP29968.1 transcriptional regulator [Thalassotalea algicola]